MLNFKFMFIQLRATTSIAVSMVGAGIIPDVQSAIPIIMVLYYYYVLIIYNAL